MTTPYGGTIDGYIKALDDILKICNDNTVIISGHGDPSNRQGLQDYRNMLVEKPATLITYRQPKPIVISLLFPNVC